MTITLSWPCPDDGIEGDYEVEGTASYDPGQGRSYSSGGSPPSWEVEITRVTDWDGRDVTESLCADEAFVDQVEELLIQEAEG